MDIIVNNAGIVTGKKFLDSADNLIEKTFAVNTTSHFWVLNHFFVFLASFCNSNLDAAISAR